MVLLLGGDVVPTDLPCAAVRLYPPIGLPNCEPVFAGGNEICFAAFKRLIAPCDLPIVAGNPDGPDAALLHLAHRYLIPW